MNADTNDTAPKTSNKPSTKEDKWVNKGMIVDNVHTKIDQKLILGLRPIPRASWGKISNELV